MEESGGILARSTGATIAYRRYLGKNPGILFIHGLRSDMNGSKAQALEAHCRRIGQAFLCLDLSGHGASSGRFEDGTIGAWAADVIDALDRLTSGPQILVGSSLGGWLMLLAALARPQRVAGLLGLAAAPDFTEDLMLKRFSEEQRQALQTHGAVMIDDCYGDQPYAITRQLIDEGRGHRVLQGPIALTCPTILIHGQQDPDVPWQTSVKLAECLNSEAVEVTLLKSAGHRLSETENMRIIITSLDRIIHALPID